MKSILVLLFLLLFVGIAPVFACTATPSPTGILPPTQTFQQVLAARVELASLIFVGTVTNGTVGQDGVINQALITPELSLKGPSSTQFAVDGFGRSSMCRIEISLGARAVFFVQVDGAGNSFIQTIDSPSEETIAQIAALTGQSISIAVSPSPTATVTLTSTLTNTPTGTATRTPTSTYTPTPTYTTSPTSTATFTPSTMPTATVTPSASPSPSPSPAPTLLAFPSSDGLTNTVVLLGSSLIALSLLGFWVMLKRRKK